VLLPLTLDAASVRHPAARDGAFALRDVSLRVRQGEALAVIGPSGAGKTTLLNAVACAMPLAGGALTLLGESPWQLSRADLHRLRGRLFLAPQVPPLPPRQRVVTAVLAGRLPIQGVLASVRSLFYPTAIPAARDALARFDLADKLFERVDRLSGGERQRVGLARALVSGAELLLIDEPLYSYRLHGRNGAADNPVLGGRLHLSGRNWGNTHALMLERMQNAMIDGRAAYWMPMDQYIGGIEHAVLHLLYARFWTRAMRDLGLVTFSEPFTKLFTQGMLLNESYYREDAAGKRQWLYPSEVETRFDDRGQPVGATARDDGLPVMLGGIEKMSKSKNNVVEPKDIIAKFGADTARVFVMFAGPPDQSAAWSDSGAEGSHRFLRRLWAFGVKHAALMADAAPAEGATPLRREMHSVLRQVTQDYERLQYNTVISGAMKMLNALEAFKGDAPAALREGYSMLLRVLYPASPHICCALWQELGFAAELGDLLDAPWPQVDEAALVQAQIELVLQVNGKMRGAVRVDAAAERGAIEAAALASPDFTRFAEGRAPKKIIVVPGRLVNVVV